MDYKAYWSAIYQSKPYDQMSWHQTSPTISLQLIQQTGISINEPIIDVGAGASTLVDHLLDRHFQDITLLDVSAQALQVTRDRLGDYARSVTWLEGDITGLALPEKHYSVWHDRAVFHFLGDVAVRRRYIEQVSRAVKPGGYVIIATFALDGPQQCSGLDVVRYDAASLMSELGGQFRLIDSTSETHITPWGSEQRFVYCCCRTAFSPNKDEAVGGVTL